jgi:hypothetical protein
MVRRASISAIIALLVLAGLYLAFRNSAARAPLGEPEPKTYHLSIKGDRLVSGPELLVATQGDSVSLLVTADRAARLHIHGYGKELPLEAGRETALAFTADRAGRFSIDLHRAGDDHAEVAVLEIQPR